MEATKKTGKAEGILAEDLLQKVVNSLKESWGGKSIKLSKEVLSEISFDSDEHQGAKRGYMSYKEFTVFNVGEKKYALAFGTKTGSYPGDKYKCDIVAFEIQHGKDRIKEFKIKMEQENHFKNSIVIARYDGQFMMSKKIIALMGKNPAPILLKDVVYNYGLFNLDGTKVVVTEAIYKRKAINFFCKKIQKYLSI